MIKESDPPIMVKLYNGTWTYYKPIFTLKYNNTNVPLPKSVRGSECFTSKDTSFKNAPRNLLKVDECNIYNEGSVCGIITTPVIASTFDNYYIHI